MALFLTHSLILIWASAAGARHLRRHPIDWILATVLLAWANIVTTSLLLAGLHRLGDPAWFFRTSLALALLTWWLLRKVRPETVAAAASTGSGSQPSPLLLAGFVLTLFPIAYASVRIAGTYVPNNYDSLAYHLPRAMFYLGQNTLAHFDTGNPRQIYFPFNYNLLQLFGLIYNPPLQCVNFLNLAAWATAGLAIYRLCRLSACSVNAALIACWLALTSTQVLAQATATTNDLPVAAGLLCALVFALRWRQTRQTRDALLSGLAAGLTAGAKLTLVFFGPAAGLLLLGIFYQHWRRREAARFFTGVRAWLVPALLAGIFCAPFAVINLVEKGEWINHTYDFTLNRPFSFASVVQTSEAYLLQLFIEPLHRFTFDMTFTGQLNAWGQETFFPHWNEAYAFSPLYLFPPDLNEDHVWYGFAGPVILLCAIFCLVRLRKSPAPMVWLAALGLGWLATYFILNKWSLYNQRYFVPAILVMSPCLAPVVEAGWSSVTFRRSTRYLLTALALSALWMTGIYLFNNTSRPYTPLWAGQPAPPALPALPPVMVQRLSGQSRINIDSTDGNERIFLLMTLGRHQHFTAFEKTNPDAYNVFSEWAFPRKVAYSNIEQRSSYTVVAIPTKRTAGVEFLGTFGRGQPAIDYYGLVPRADQVKSGRDDRNVLVVFNYGPHEPDRYKYLRLKIAGLNPPDQARLTLGVEYADRTTETLATFTANGEATATVLRPFLRFTVRVQDQASEKEIGAIDIPYLTRTESAEDEASENPAALFSDELVDAHPKSRVTTTGLAGLEGPYAQWDLPVIRWAKSPVVRLEIPASNQLGRLQLSFSLRLQARDTASIDVMFNGQLVKNYPVAGRNDWLEQTLQLTPQAGKNVVEFRNVLVGDPDWLDYAERYPDVKAYLVAQNIPLEKGAQEHWETFGRHETRTLNYRRKTEALTSGDPFYFLFRSLRIEGFRK